jgi:hypothetical protein
MANTQHIAIFKLASLLNSQLSPTAIYALFVVFQLNMVEWLFVFNSKQDHKFVWHQLGMQ